MKEGLEPLPNRMTHLPLDERGYPIPWFVAYIDGKPEFRAMDNRKWLTAIKENRCWVCGGILGVNKVFVVGPMCGVNRTTSEPPCHLDCAQWSARNCPFLSNPNMTRREDENIHQGNLAEKTAGIALSRNPGVVLLWITKNYVVFQDPRGRPLISMGEPERVEWWCRGRTASYSEVKNSIETGLPALEALAAQQDGGLAHLDKMKQRLEPLLPTREIYAN